MQTIRRPGRAYFGDLDIDGKEILQWILNKYGGECMERVHLVQKMVHKLVQAFHKWYI